ncbi:hypothetical protein Vafri_2530 [Volvox africanus]|uniref:peptidylprolyl isomerase n=1 Tax=Volvox africanus TaxID=51714 RepID=A0A8J4AR69_9CHLO|nr:hypothetical protein Vafri_2530 [Volvox africanus]
MAFWSAIVKPGKPHPYVPPPEEWNLHLSQAAIAPTVPEGRRVALAVKTDPEDEAVIICTLAAGCADTAALDLFFSQYTEFSVIGEHELHLTGYYTPSQLLDDDDEGEDDEDSDYQPGALGFPIHAGDGEGDDDDEDEDEDDELDGLGEDEDEDEDSMDVDGDDEEELFGYEAMLRSKRKPHVVIEDVTDHPENNKDSKGATAAAEPAAADKKAKAGANAGNAVKVEPKEDSEESEEGEEEEDDEGEDEDEDEEDDEEEEEQDTQAQKGGKVQLPTARSKRPLDAAKPTANGTAKVDGPDRKKQAVGQQQQPQAQPVSKPHDKRQKAEAKQQQDEKPAKQVLKQQEGTKQQEPKQQESKQQQKEKETKAGKKNIRSHPNGFTIEDVSYGDPKGKLAKPGQKVAMRYVGRLKANGKEFDRSGKQPFRFRLGVGEVIKVSGRLGVTAWPRGTVTVVFVILLACCLSISTLKRKG